MNRFKLKLSKEFLVKAIGNRQHFQQHKNNKKFQDKMSILKKIYREIFNVASILEV